jgi:hypothetical protein
VFGAAGSFLYPQSRTTVEKFPTDFRPPRRWLTIFAYGGFGILLVVGSFCLLTQVYLPGSRLEEVEAVARKTFQEKLGREPAKVQLEENGRRGFWGFLKGPWVYTGTARLDDGSRWHVTVRWDVNGWECRADPPP